MKGWQKVLLFIFPYFIIVGIFQFIGGQISGYNIVIHTTEETSFQVLMVNLFGLFGTFLLLWVFMKFIDKQAFSFLGFHTKNRLLDFFIGFIIGLSIMLSAWFLLVFFKEIFYTKFNVDFQELLISIALFSIVALVEEALFRGYFLKNLMESFNKYIALIISSILFSLAHGLNPNVDLFSLFNIFLAGILLGLSYIYTKNLWFPIALHFSWNFFQSLLGFNVSGQDFYSIIEFKINQENPLNGGAFGFEGSYLSIITMIITIFGIGIYYNKKPSIS